MEMTMISDDFDPLAYVTAACPSVGLKLSPARLAEIAEAFALVVRVGRPALEMEVPAEAEPAPVFSA
jgi:acyl-CoA hydrolase